MNPAPDKLNVDESEMNFGNSDAHNIKSPDTDSDNPSGDSSAAQIASGASRSSARIKPAVEQPSTSGEADSNQDFPVIRKPVSVAQSGPLRAPVPGTPVEPPPDLTPDVRSSKGPLNLDDIKPVDLSDKSDPVLDLDDWPASDQWVDRTPHARPMAPVSAPLLSLNRLWPFAAGLLVFCFVAAVFWVFQSQSAQQWFDRTLAGITGSDAGLSEQVSPASVALDNVSSDTSPVAQPKSISELFNIELETLEALLEQGDFDQAESVLLQMDRTVYGYGAPEFALVKERIANYRDEQGLQDSGVANDEAMAIRRNSDQQLANQGSVEQDRLEAEAAQLALERLAQQQADAEAERLKQQQAEAEAERLKLQQAQAEAERLKQQQAEAEAERLKLQQAQAEAERLKQQQAQAEAERLKQQQAEAEAERLKQQQAEAEWLKQQQQARADAERLNLERAERDRAEAEAQRLELRRVLQLERAAAEAERLELQNELKRERQAAAIERRELQRMVEQERAAAKVERLALQVAEEKRLAAEKERLATQRAKAEREEAEAKRLAAQRVEKQKADAEKERLARQLASQKQAAAEAKRIALQRAERKARADAVRAVREQAQTDADLSVTSAAYGSREWNELAPKPASESELRLAEQQRRAALQERLGNSATDSTPVTPIALANPPTEPSLPPGTLSQPNAIEVDARRITDADIQSVYQQFTQLQNAIEQLDISAVLQLTERSGARIQQVLQMFENNVAITAQVRNVSTLDSTSEIQGILRITRLERADGSITGPPLNMGAIRLSSVREGDKWSSIRW